MHISLHSMRYSDIMFAWKKNQKSFTTKALHFDATPSQASGLIETTMFRMPHIESGELVDCIRKSGKMPMGLFQRAIIFTTRMKTRSTMRLKTLNASQSQTTTLIISQPTLRKNWQSVESGSIVYGQQRLTGIAQKRVEHGIKSLGIWLGILLSILLASVKTVVKSFNIPRWAIRNCIAPTNAKLLLAINQASTMSSACVKSAETSLPSTNTVPSSAAPVNVPNACEEVKRQRVYITIDPVGEDFPIGIFVWNEDTDRYMVARFDLRPTDVHYSQRWY